MNAHKCAYCGRLLQEDVLYCPSCGGPQVYETDSGGVRLQSLDPWVITDPEAKDRFQNDPEAVEALVNTWRNDPNHARTRQIQAEIEQSLDQRRLTRIAYFYCCPWAPVYTVNQDVRIGGKRLRRGQQFTFDISAEGIEPGEGFKREVLVGDFQPTDEIDYCLPGQEHDEGH